MGIPELFKPVEEVSVEQVRGLIEKKRPGEYCLLDVRQPSEYAEGHLPGARLMPLSELTLRHEELDPGRTTVVYCRSGQRSRSAAGILNGLGFPKVLSMAGGIMAYRGFVASGEPEAGVFCFPDWLTPAQLVAVAWLVEDGTIAFIDGVRGSLKGQTEALDTAREEKLEHQKALEALYQELAGEAPAADFPEGVIESPPETMIVGCVKLEQALQWARGRLTDEVLELLLALEANALDLYLKLQRMVRSEEAREVFGRLSDRQQRSVGRMAAVFEAALKQGTGE